MHFIYISGWIVGVILLLSNASGVPQVVTGAPGESGFSCNACHSGGNYNTQIQAMLLKDGNPVSTYIPGETYQLRVSVSGMNDPRSFGFQLVCLKGSDNSDLGIWSQLGDRVRTRTMINRVYLQQSNPKADGVFTANWKAPSDDVGPVNFYYSGLAVNLNGNTTGDQHAVSSFSIAAANTSSTDNTGTQKGRLRIWPLPAHDVLNVEAEDSEKLLISDLNGRVIMHLYDIKNGINISGLPAGVYIINAKNKSGLNVGTAKFVKQ